jgi:amidase
VHNPRRHGYSAGGSSSGSAALVAADTAIGGDKAGSIRIPYTGVIPIESTLDHVGPITASVVDNALLLEVLAGPDGLDPRQYAPQTVRYTEALGRSVAGMKIRHCARGFWLGQFRAGRGARSSPRR